MEMPTEPFSDFERALRDARARPIVIDTFRHYYGQMQAGQTGMIAEDDIDAVDDVADFDSLPDMRDAGRKALAHTAVIKLNGGLGTSMGLDRAKSLLPVKNDLSFLDIIARQVLALRRHVADGSLPLLFMTSFSTHDDTLNALWAYPDLAVEGLPLAFIQNKVPKVLADSGQLPALDVWGEHAWCPPGHGDLYTALFQEGTLDALLDRGIHYAFVSNADNLGATLDLNILGHVATRGIPFLMEVADRTAADRKGGHLARRRVANNEAGRLVLREVAQCPSHALDAFQDISRHCFFNTNNIWLDLREVRRLLERSGGIFRLPLIRNRKTIDPNDPASPPVYQLETAMGAAIELFEGARALRVPRTRFAPVKLCSDLLVLWSDAYTLNEDFHLVLQSPQPPIVQLDDAFYKKIDGLRQRFPHGAPSLRACRRLEIVGDVTFGRDVIISGTVSLEGPMQVADQTRLSS